MLQLSTGICLPSVDVLQVFLFAVEGLERKDVLQLEERGELAIVGL